jgi:hypothetical protein
VSSGQKEHVWLLYCLATANRNQRQPPRIIPPSATKMPGSDSNRSASPGAPPAPDYEPAHEPAHEDDAPEADGEETMDVDENLGDMGGSADDGDDSDPHKFIEKSLHFQDMLLTKKQAEERVTFFTEFARCMPKGKHPTKKLAMYNARVEKVDKRIIAFKIKYAKQRKEAREARTVRIAKEKEDRKEEEALGRPLKSAIGKKMKNVGSAAAKAAHEAILALSEDADDDAKIAAGFKAYQTAMKAALEQEAWKPAPKEKKEKKAKKAKEPKEPTEPTEANEAEPVPVA